MEAVFKSENGSNYFIGYEKEPVDNTYYAVLAKSLATLLMYNPYLEDKNYLMSGLYRITRESTLPENLRAGDEQGIVNKIYVQPDSESLYGGTDGFCLDFSRYVQIEKSAEYCRLCA